MCQQLRHGGLQRFDNLRYNDTGIMILVVGAVPSSQNQPGSRIIDEDDGFWKSVCVCVSK